MRVVFGSVMLFITTVMVSSLSAADWPQFRGPGGQGSTGEENLPLVWSDTENIAWRTGLPGRGRSSPIVFGDRVFATTGIEEDLTRRVLCFDRRTGMPLW